MGVIIGPSRGVRRRVKGKNGQKWIMPNQNQPITDSPVDVKAARGLVEDTSYTFQILANRPVYFDETDVEPQDTENAVFLFPKILYTVTVTSEKIFVWAKSDGGSIRIAAAA